MVRILAVTPMDGRCVRLQLTTGEEITRDLSAYLTGPVFEAIHQDPQEFRRVFVHEGTLVWPNGADLCPDLVIWGGMPPDSTEGEPPVPELRGASY
jgi:Protein of unknown function (DUF2442)